MNKTLNNPPSNFKTNPKYRKGYPKQIPKQSVDAMSSPVVPVAAAGTIEARAEANPQYEGSVAP